MTKSLVELAAAREGRAQRATEDATARMRTAYTVLILRSADPRPGDDKKLAECQRALGLSAADVAENVALVERYQSVRAHGLRYPASDEARNEAIRQDKRTDQAAAEETKIIAERVEQAKLAVRRATDRREGAKGAKNALPHVRAEIEAAGLDPAALDPQLPNEGEQDDE